MPAKRKAPKKRARRSAEPQRVRETVAENNVRLRARLGELLSDHFKDVDRIEELEKKLAANARAFARIDGERTFLWEEIDRFRSRLMDYIGWEMQLPEDARVALNKVRAQESEDDKPDEDAEDPPSDDLKDIEALQDLALRGGVA